jgi:TRAP-type mannitol/chloroaromatic compound transport system permease small subunit
VLTILCIVLAAFLAGLSLAAARSARAARLAEPLASAAKALPRLGFALACACLALLALVQFTVVIAVSVFSLSVIWLQDLTTYLFGASFLLAGGAVLLADEHVRVDVLYARWPARRQALVNLLGLALLVLPVCALIVAASGSYVAASWAEMERSSEPSGVHAVFLLKSMIPAFAVLLALAAFAKAVDAAAAIRARP